MHPLGLQKPSEHQGDSYPYDGCADMASAPVAHKAISAPEKADVFASLRQKIESQQGPDRRYLATNIPYFDDALSGGLAHRHVHLITALHGDAAATGFIISLLRAQQQSAPGTIKGTAPGTIKGINKAQAPIIWCSPRFSGYHGHLCAEGMWAMGLDPAKIIFVHDSHPARLLSAFEEALKTTGIAGVVAEYGLLASKSGQWLRWAQRLRRAARAGDSLGFLLGPPAPSTGFETGWSIASKPADENQRLDWRPRWSVELIKSRKGGLASADICYCPVSGQLRLIRDTSTAPQASLPFTHQLPSAASGAASGAAFGITSGDNQLPAYLHHAAN